MAQSLILVLLQKWAGLVYLQNCPVVNSVNDDRGDSCMCRVVDMNVSAEPCTTLLSGTLWTSTHKSKLFASESNTKRIVKENTRAQSNKSVSP